MLNSEHIDTRNIRPVVFLDEVLTGFLDEGSEMIKTIVWLSLAFLLGGITAVTYFSLFAPEYNEVNTVTSNAKYVSLEDDYYEYPMKYIDSVTARSNEKFTRRHVVQHPSPEILTQL